MERQMKKWFLCGTLLCWHHNNVIPMGTLLRWRHKNCICSNSTLIFLIVLSEETYLLIGNPYWAILIISVTYNIQNQEIILQFKCHPEQCNCTNQCSVVNVWHQQKQSMTDGRRTKWSLCGALLCWRHKQLNDNNISWTWRFVTGTRNLPI